MERNSDKILVLVVGMDLTLATTLSIIFQAKYHLDTLLVLQLLPLKRKLYILIKIGILEICRLT